MFGVLAANIEEFFKIHDGLMDRFSIYVQEKEFSISRRSLQFNRRWFYDDKSAVSVFDFGEKDPKIDLDPQSKKVLDILAQNSRTKIVDIASKSGLSNDVVSYTIKRMEREGMIKGYKCLLNPSKLGFVTCKSFVYFKNINEVKKAAFVEYTKMIPQCINIVITFAPWDLEIMFEVDNFEHFYTIMEDIKERFKDIVKLYNGLLITSEPKQVFVT